MKLKNVIIALSFTVVLSSCKKEKSDPVLAIKSEIVGTRASTGFTDIYYDASGKEVNRTQTPDNGGTKLTFNSNGQINVPSTPDKSSSYTLTNSNGKVILEFGGGPPWETTINGDVMQMEDGERHYGSKLYEIRPDNNI